MRWLADECVAAPLVAALRAAGHDVAYIVEVEPRAKDTDIVALAQSEGRILLTEDKDFGELAFRRFTSAPGIVLLRVDPSRSALRWERLLSAIETFGESLLGKHTVIDAKRMRSRSLPRP